ncbi:hypothetical protein FQ377_05890 [Arthrobacter echini]|uniref:Uncharacterized protein n=1 Tax=Arthrobacter echini TaxID=1529066 RepID=A0A5D0XSM0_9MICC|nr:hypothetical protein [Arthrobacter echini]TYC99490.1 hypothetical protein FQ377_05890 [Arthrobacter echini]
MGVGTATVLLVPLMVGSGGQEPADAPSTMGVAPTQLPPGENLPGGAGAAGSEPITAEPSEGVDGPPGSPVPPGSGMGGDLPVESLPAPGYPSCAVDGAGTWWTDPADPYTCLPPVSRPFHEPTPPGMPPELSQPIFGEPPVSRPFHEPTPPGMPPELSQPIFGEPPVSRPFHEPTPPGMPPELSQPIFGDPAEALTPDDCRVTGAMQCTVTIMDQVYVVDFVDGEPVAVAAAR